MLNFSKKGQSSKVFSPKNFFNLLISRIRHLCTKVSTLTAIRDRIPKPILHILEALLREFVGDLFGDALVGALFDGLWDPSQDAKEGPDEVLRVGFLGVEKAADDAVLQGCGFGQAWVGVAMAE